MPKPVTSCRRCEATSHKAERIGECAACEQYCCTACSGLVIDGELLCRGCIRAAREEANFEARALMVEQIIARCSACQMDRNGVLDERAVMHAPDSTCCGEAA